MVTKYGLKETDIKCINNIFTQFNTIEVAIIYGSRAKGNYKPASEIDLTLKGNELDISVLNRLSWVLDDLLLPYTFDISLFKNISNKNLIEHIDRVGIIFYNRTIPI